MKLYVSIGRCFTGERITDALSEDLIVAAFLADWEETQGKEPKSGDLTGNRF